MTTQNCYLKARLVLGTVPAICLEPDRLVCSVNAVAEQQQTSHRRTRKSALMVFADYWCPYLQDGFFLQHPVLDSFCTLGLVHLQRTSNLSALRQLWTGYAVCLVLRSRAGGRSSRHQLTRQLHVASYVEIMLPRTRLQTHTLQQACSVCSYSVTY